MLICGIKITHDAAIALIDNGRLVFSYEMEKINNNPRYSTFNLKWNEVEDILRSYGYSADSIDSWVVDGWHGNYSPVAQIDSSGSAIIRLNEYNPLIKNKNVLDVLNFNPGYGFPSYKSYHHISGHIVGAYCASPFAKEQQSSFVLVWDGAIGAQLYYFDFEKREFEFVAIVHYLYGDAYAEFAHRFKPFTQFGLGDMSLPGKVMAYIAKGSKQQLLLDNFHLIYKKESALLPSRIDDNTYREFSKRVHKATYNFGVEHGFEGVDMMATFHQFIQETLLMGLSREISKISPSYQRNICFTGGCALNIKWNSAIRLSGLFEKVWIPPFTNDSGNAIGTACCEMLRMSKNTHLTWNVFSGPSLRPPTREFYSWKKVPCSLKQLAALIHHYNEPVVFLCGRAELGPRALGHRSILASATSGRMKNILNEIKDREDYRPVAPICLEEDSINVFEPGGADPFMLFDHQIKSNWLPLIPAVAHLDDSARLQTVNESENPEIYYLLTEYKRISGIPLLCNTSANYNGKGFFPDTESAIKWGGANFVWSDEFLWFRKAPRFEESFLQQNFDTNLEYSSVSLDTLQ